MSSPTHGRKRLRCLAVAATAACAAVVGAAGRVRAQEPWPNARCYELTGGKWRVEGDTMPTVGPYTEQVDEDERSARFRYASAAALQRVRTCLAAIAEQVRPTQGVYITVVTALADELTAWSDHSQATARTPIPKSVTANPACGGTRLAPVR
jgi:hypothetical protein